MTDAAPASVAVRDQAQADAERANRGGGEPRPRDLAGELTAVRARCTSQMRNEDKIGGVTR